MKELALIIYNDIPENYILAAVPMKLMDAKLIAALTELHGHTINSKDCPEFSEDLMALRNDLAIDTSDPGSAKYLSGKWKKYEGLVQKYRYNPHGNGWPFSAIKGEPLVIKYVFCTEFLM